MRRARIAAIAALAIAAAAPATAVAHKGGGHHRGKGLWKVYDKALSRATYVDLTHSISPNIPVWTGFGPATFSPAVNPTTGQPYTYAEHGFEATAYRLATDQFGTQLDPPAHWAPEYPGIDELPPTYAVRPLVVISIARQVRENPRYSLSVDDVRRFERRHGRIPKGSVVMVRSDWSERWTDEPEAAKELAADRNFPSVGLDALKFLHLERQILFHGHEPLDTDTTPTLEGEFWLMHNGYTQAEGVDNLAGLPATGCLVSIGYAKFKGGLGGYARYIAICPPGTANGSQISERDAPLPKSDSLLHWDPSLGYRVR